jgi:hypothetical protein
MENKALCAQLHCSYTLFISLSVEICMPNFEESKFALPLFKIQPSRGPQKLKIMVRLSDTIYPLFSDAVSFCAHVGGGWLVGKSDMISLH